MRMYKASCTSWVAHSALMLSPPDFCGRKWERQPKLARCPKGNFIQGGESEGDQQLTRPFQSTEWHVLSSPGSSGTFNEVPFNLLWPCWKPWGTASTGLQRLLWWDRHHREGHASACCHHELLQAHPPGTMSRWDIGFDLAQLAGSSPLAEKTKAGVMCDRD